MLDLERTIAKARSLPVLPQVATKLLEVVKDTSAQAKDVGKIIESDQSLAAQILKQVNSPFYGFSGRISTLRHAVVIMGFKSIKNIALGFSITKMSRRGANSVLNTEKFWEHSLGVGVGARSIGMEIGYNCPEELLAAGLLHDIGKMILSDNLPGEYKKVLEEAERSGKGIYEIEEKLLGNSHAEVGVWFAVKNRFPCVLKACVKYHHIPFDQGSEEFGLAVKAIYLADQLCKQQGIGWAGDSICSEKWEVLCEEMGVTAEVRKKIVDNLQAEVEEGKEFFGI